MPLGIKRTQQRAIFRPRRRKQVQPFRIDDNNGLEAIVRNTAMPLHKILVNMWDGV